MRTLSFIATCLLALAAAPALATKVDCEPARCATAAAVAAECPCQDATNHGRYVSCVAHVVRRLSAEGTIPITCKGKVTRCAARSTCGKPGFVTCQIPTDTCVIVPPATSGTCEDDAAIICLTDLDCGARCKIKSTGERCTEKGGFVGTATSCCADCGD